jgi:uncharacterized protein RhaS with RHS repeats
MSSVGRWLTPDPIGFADGPNLYTYCHNDPIAYVDPDGQFAFLLAPLAISIVAEYCLPAACTYLGQYAGGTLAASFLTGMLSGYNDTLTTMTNSSFYSMGSADPGSFFCNRAGVLIGAVITLSPQKQGVNAVKATANMALREMSQITTTAVVSKAQSCFNRFATSSVRNTATQKAAQVAEGHIAKRAMPSLDKLSNAGKAIDRNGLTKAGRAYAKHCSRSGSVFPTHIGKASDKNVLGQFHLEDILTHPRGFQKNNKFGGVDFYRPDGSGVRFYSDGSFRGFLEPKI